MSTLPHHPGNAARQTGADSEKPVNAGDVSSGVGVVSAPSSSLTHQVSVQSDVTGQVLATRERDAARAETARARQAQAVAEEAGRFGRLLLVLSEALTATTTVGEIAATVTGVVTAELGAAGGGLLLADAARTRLDFVTLADMPAQTDASWSRIDWNEDAPLAQAVRTREAVFFPDTEAMIAAHPSITDHAEVPVMGASANLPLVVGGDVLGAVFLHWATSRPVLVHQQAALEALGRYTAQAVQRALLLAERRSAAETLQRSLLTRLPEPDHLELRARYVPAAAGEHVGGDWYDAVVLPDGATTLVIGDVTGHDMAAAAHMGQLRGLLRAFAYDRVEPPTEIVARLDRAVAGLGIEGLATLVLARIEQSEQDAEVGVRRLRWTNAGHPPPVLLLADGSTQVLQTDPEMLIGLVPGTARTNHEQVLPPGCTLLLFTDGLIEHRGRSIDDGIADLRRVLSTCRDCSLQELLDHVVGELVGDAPEDDCAILAVRPHPEDRPRPAEAGPNVDLSERVEVADFDLVQTEAPGARRPSEERSGTGGDTQEAGGSELATRTTELVLEPDPAAVGQARAFVHDYCCRLPECGDICDTLTLLVSEVVTNAFLHGRSQARVRVHATPTWVRVEVSDDDSRLPVLSETGPDALGGRGLALVDVLADAWGVREEEVGKTVWVELRAG